MLFFLLPPLCLCPFLRLRVLTIMPSSPCPSSRIHLFKDIRHCFIHAHPRTQSTVDLLRHNRKIKSLSILPLPQAHKQHNTNFKYTHNTKITLIYPHSFSHIETRLLLRRQRKHNLRVEVTSVHLKLVYQKNR